MLLLHNPLQFPYFLHLQQIQEKYNFVLLLNSENRGRPYSRNRLLDAIESKYVSWLDAGDEWYPSKLENQFGTIDDIESLDTKKRAWITTNYDWIWKGGITKKTLQRTDGDQIKNLLIGTSLRAYLWTLLGTAESFKMVGYFDERLPRLQDLDYFIRFQLHGGRIYNTNSSEEPLCAYHKSDDGRNALQIRDCNKIIFDKHRTLYNRYGADFVKMRLFKMEMLSWRFAHNNSDRRLARRYMAIAAYTRPNAFLQHCLRKRGIRP